MAQYIQLVTTTARRAEAEQIAHSLIDERLAGCVQIVGPITSVYRWEGKVETSEEWQCVIKSRADLLGRLQETLRRLHPYQVPEMLALPVLDGNADYLQWLDGELQQSRS